jgi:hypothetical protein
MSLNLNLKQPVVLVALERTANLLQIISLSKTKSKISKDEVEESGKIRMRLSKSRHL